MSQLDDFWYCVIDTICAHHVIALRAIGSCNFEHTVVGTEFPRIQIERPAARRYHIKITATPIQIAGQAHHTPYLRQYFTKVTAAERPNRGVIG
jgi:hypothetical protein